jgi:hypothetical protein
MDEQELQLAAARVDAAQADVKRQAVQVAHAAMMVRVMMGALGQRLLLLLAMILDAGMFSWAMVSGTWERIAAAVLFAIGVWFLIKVTPRPPPGEPHET